MPPLSRDSRHGPVVLRGFGSSSCLVDDACSMARLTVGVVHALQRSKHKEKTVGSGSYKCQQVILEASAEGEQARNDQAEMYVPALRQRLWPPFKTMIGGATARGLASVFLVAFNRRQ